MEPRAGFTLLELLVVLMLTALLLVMVAEPAHRWRDAAAVRAARDELASGLAWTRLAAVSHGGASIVLDPPTARYWTVLAGDTLAKVDLRGRYGVELETGSAERVTLEWDAVGVGRVASRTVRLRRGGAEAGLIISGHGRFRRW